ncbi:riboflavin synthase [Chthonobacter albigriseus]|uniref:riboflavin synthase n=1 Tax=Chthonobacter albigriseus TaxID=1683161 RepID=UPI0015EEBCF1|nr:riboflavin synthase [Chthonobacter albigriseus]
MFTGIVTDVGEVAALVPRETGVKLRIATAYDPETIALGASIACAGACLTVIERGIDGNRRFFDVEASVETLDKTTLGDWRVGTRINLERALKIGDELGGHIVTGHVDGVATLAARDDVGDMARLTFEAPHALARFIAQKGSVTLDGTSLTVNDVEGDRFSVMLIPHTLAMTTWGASRAGDRVNLEVDTMARYAARLIEAG